MYSHSTVPSSLLKTDIFSDIFHTDTFGGLKAIMLKHLCVSRPFCTPSTGLCKDTISPPVSSASCTSIDSLPLKLKHQVNHSCTWQIKPAIKNSLLALGHLQLSLNKPSVTSLQLQGHRRPWKWLVFPLSVTGKVEQWDALPGDSSL